MDKLLILIAPLLSNTTQRPHELTEYKKFYFQPWFISKGELLGTGGFSRVYSGVFYPKPKSMISVAIKCSRLNKPERKGILYNFFFGKSKKQRDIEKYLGVPGPRGFKLKYILREVTLMRACGDSPFVSHLISAFFVRNEFWLITDLYTIDLLALTKVSPKTEILKHLYSREPKYISVRCLSVELVMYLAVPLFLALQHLQTRRIVHRDVSVFNILLSSDGIPKLCDFGLAIECPKESELIKSNGSIGTEPFIAPEVFATCDYDYRADIWSLFITLNCLKLGGNPFFWDSGTFKPLMDMFTYFLKEEKLSKDWETSKKLQQKSLLQKTGLIGEGKRINPFKNESDNVWFEYVKFMMFLGKLDSDERPFASQVIEHEYIKNEVVLWKARVNHDDVSGNEASEKFLRNKELVFKLIDRHSERKAKTANKV